MWAGIGRRAAVLFALGVSVAAAEPTADVKVAHRHLEPVCLDGAPVKPGERNWRLEPGTHSLALTMRNDPRQGMEPHQRVVPKGAPGVAAVSFNLEAGHRYEVEVRAPATAFSTRLWERGEWRPVVRDRTVDREVSGEPLWLDAGCRR